MRRINYSSPEWQKMQLIVYQRANNHCELCGYGGRWLSMRRIKDKRLEALTANDVLLVCKDCGKKLPVLIRQREQQKQADSGLVC